MSSTEHAVDDLALLRSLFGQVASSLGLIVDRDIQVDELSCERSPKRAAGKGSVHISFKLGFLCGGVRRQGCLLLPLAEAMTLAGCLSMLPEIDVNRAREVPAPDTSAKEAMMEIGTLMCSAVSESLAEFAHFEQLGVRVISEGCQGVRTSIRPALDNPEEIEFLVGRGQWTIEGYQAFEAMVLLPIVW